MSTASISEFAREHGVSHTAVRKWVKRGLADVDRQGRIVRESSNTKLAARPRVYRGGQIGGTPRGGPWSGNGNGRDDGNGELRLPPDEWDVLLLRETFRRMKAVGVKAATKRELARVANVVLSEWRNGIPK